jgi:hypothetical protein
MSKRFYTGPTAIVEATPPGAPFQALATPGLPAWSLVMVEHWRSHEAEDAWLALPNVTEHYIENLSQPAPAAVIAAFAPWGATAGMTLRQVLALIRQSGALAFRP